VRRPTIRLERLPVASIRVPIRVDSPLDGGGRFALRRLSLREAVREEPALENARVGEQELACGAEVDAHATDGNRRSTPPVTAADRVWQLACRVPRQLHLDS